LDIVKDRLYCEGTTSKKRRAAQTTLHRILNVLVHLMAPILSFTAEEIWRYLPAKTPLPASVFFSPIPLPDSTFLDQQLADKWERIFKERGEVLKALEAARNGGIIGHSLDAEVVVFGAVGTTTESALGKLQAAAPKMAEDVVIVSQLAAQNGQLPSYLWELEEARRAGKSGMSASLHDNGREGWAYYSELMESVIAVFKARGAKCERCWKYDIAIGNDKAHPTVCPRCAAVLNSGVSV
jgi:isoleucyl-tRNA synthetase